MSAAARGIYRPTVSARRGAGIILSSCVIASLRDPAPGAVDQARRCPLHTRHPGGERMAITLPPAAPAETRVELTDPAALDGSPYANPDLLPVPIARRTWRTYNYAALWVGMSHNLVTYTLAASLIALGMSPVQALVTIAAGNVVVLLPMLLNSHAGTRYGIPFPVFARAFYGVRGANFAALLRALVACGWFGIQTWIGGEGVYAIGSRAFGSWWSNAAQFGGHPWTVWLSFAVFWVIQMGVLMFGMDAVRRFENWAAPAVLLVFLALLGWMIAQAHGVGPLLSAPGSLGWGGHFWPVFWPSLMAMIAYWSTLSLNMPDFTRFSRSQKGQAVGQVLGLPTTMTFFSLVAVMITSGTVIVYGKQITDPTELAAKFSNPAVVVLAVLTALVATVSVNVAANVVSPAYDFSNAWPRRVSFRTGAIVTGVLGVVIMPWKLLSDPHVYIYNWLGFYGGVLGAVAGVLVAGYWFKARTRLELPALYLPRSRYWYTGGWNWRAVGATVLGAVLAVGGANEGANGAPFPPGGLIPFLKPLAPYSWAVGFGAGFLVYLLLAAPHRIAGAGRPVPAAAAAPGAVSGDVPEAAAPEAGPEPEPPAQPPLGESAGDS
jgi:NCS1 family nucleobase:cation symporter-1